MPISGAKSKLFANVPFSMMSVAGVAALKPRRHNCDVKVSARGRARRKRRVEAVDAVAELLVVGHQPRAGMSSLQELVSRSPLRTWTSRIGTSVLLREIVTAVDDQPALASG